MQNYRYYKTNNKEMKQKRPNRGSIHCAKKKRANLYKGNFEGHKGFES